MEISVIGPHPIARILVNHRDVTSDFSPYLQAISYVDHLSGEADGLEITLVDPDRRWLGAWYPIKGTTLEAWLGLEGSPLMACGEFSVDEMDFSPNLVVLRALATGSKTQMRTTKTRNWGSVSLRQVAEDVAGAHGLQVVGTVPDLQWPSLAQHRETDLALLQRLASDLGVVFTIKSGRLVFHDLEELEQKPSVLLIHESDVTSWSFRDKTVPGASSASYFDGDSGELQVVELQLAPQSEQAKKTRRAPSKAHAQRMSRAALRISKSQERSGTLTLPGDIRLRAGRTVELHGWSQLDGLWMIQSARHSLDAGGYRSELEVHHVVA